MQRAWRLNVLLVMCRDRQMGGIGRDLLTLAELGPGHRVLLTTIFARHGQPATTIPNFSLPCPTGMLSYLQAKYDAVLVLHHTHYEAALQLQATMRNEVLGRLAEERQLDGRSLSDAREWVDDYGKSHRSTVQWW